MFVEKDYWVTQVLRALHQLVQEGCRVPWRLIIAGDGVERPRLEAFVAEASLGGRVHMPGHRADVANLQAAADILVMPDIESGNMLAKQLTFLGNADAAGIVLGARVPVMLTSRADNLRARLLSCALAVLLSQARKQGRIK